MGAGRQHSIRQDLFEITKSFVAAQSDSICAVRPSHGEAALSQAASQHPNTQYHTSAADAVLEEAIFCMAICSTVQERGADEGNPGSRCSKYR